MKCLFIMGLVLLVLSLSLIGSPTYVNKSLDIYMILAQMEVESSGDWSAIGMAGEIGLMQIKPSTAREFGIKEWTLYHPIMNLDSGIRLMEFYWSRYYRVSDPMERWSLSLATFNHPLTYRKYHRLGRRWRDSVPYGTRKYIKKILARYYGKNY